MAGQGDVLVRPDALVFPPVEEGRPVLHRHPFPGEEEILNVERWLDAGHDAVHLACLDMEDAILEVHRVRLGLKAADAGKSAVREQRPVDAALALPAWDVLKASRGLQPAARFFAAVELYTQAEDQFAA
jgi:hypothetical protein